MYFSSQVYLRKDIWRLGILLAFFIGLPCLVLILLAQQSVRAANQRVVEQFRADCQIELEQIGRQAGEQLLSRLGDLAKSWSALAARPSEFWATVAEDLPATRMLKTVFLVSPNNRIQFPPALGGMLKDVPQLSRLHPAKNLLREARRALWVEQDYGRACSLYRALLERPHIPTPVRAAVYAEMAEGETRRGQLEMALEYYQSMGEILSEHGTTIGPAALLNLVRAIELAREAGRDDWADEWRETVLAFLGSEGISLPPDLAAFAAGRIRDGWPAGSEGNISARLTQVERLANLRRHLDRLMASVGRSPLAWVGPPDSGFRRAVPVANAEPLAGEELTGLLLVGQEPLPGQERRLGMEVDPEAFQEVYLTPLLRRFTEQRGGIGEANVQRFGASPAATSAPGSQLLEIPLPAPLDLMVLRYDLNGSTLLQAITASRARYQRAMLAVAVFMLVMGVVLVVVKTGGSLETARLQADVMDRISHELRTPVAAICLLSETLHRDKSADLIQRRRITALLAAESRRMQGLLERLLSFARQRRGKPRVIRSRGRLDAIVSGVVGSFPVEMGLDPSAISLEIEPGDYSGFFDHDALEQALRNLLDNGVKYCEGPPRVRVALRCDHEAALLTVTDNGIGMDARTRRRIFRPYYRADTALSARVGGIGIGLSIVRDIVRGHRGVIRVTSAKGKGSTFEVRLPLRRAGKTDL